MPEERPQQLQPIYDPFPVRAESAESVSRNLIRTRGGSNLEILYTTATNFRTENPDLFVFMAESAKVIAQSRPQIPFVDYLIGASIGYELLAAEARLKGGQLPQIPEEVIETRMGDDLSFGIEQRYNGDYLLELGKQEPALVELLQQYFDRRKIADQVRAMAIVHVFAVFRTNKEIQEVRNLVEGS